MNNLASETPEFWVELKLNPQYLISNHGRVINLKSYGGKPRFITPSLRNNKYLFVTITWNNKRKTLSLNKIVKMNFTSL